MKNEICVCMYVYMKGKGEIPISISNMIKANTSILLFLSKSNCFFNCQC